MKLGLLPPTHDDRDLLLDYYLVASKLPPIPKVFGHSHIFPRDAWGILGNATVGDCAVAGPAHETMVWTKLGGHPAYFTDAVVLADYSAITGYNPADPSTDRGSNADRRRRSRGPDGRGSTRRTRRSCGASQFHDNQVWDLVPGAQDVGGHYIPVFDINDVGPVCVTWGRPQQMTWRFFEAQCTLAYAYLSTEQLKHGLSVEGFNAAQLQADLAQVRN